MCVCVHASVYYICCPMCTCYNIMYVCTYVHVDVLCGHECVHMGRCTVRWCVHCECIVCLCTCVYEYVHWLYILCAHGCVCMPTIPQYYIVDILVFMIVDMLFVWDVYMINVVIVDNVSVLFPP